MGLFPLERLDIWFKKDSIVGLRQSETRYNNTTKNWERKTVRECGMCDYSSTLDINTHCLNALNNLYEILQERINND